MTDETPAPDLRLVWQSQPVEENMIALDALRNKTNTFRRKVLRRNRIGNIAAVVVTVVFASMAIRINDLLLQIGCGLIIAAAWFGALYLHRRGEPKQPPATTTLSEHIAFYKVELSQQRDLFRTLAWWQLAPFLPGFGFFLAGVAHAHLKGLPASARLVVCVIGFVLTWALSQRRARRLQEQIDALDSGQIV